MVRHPRLGNKHPWGLENPQNVAGDGEPGRWVVRQTDSQAHNSVTRLDIVVNKAGIWALKSWEGEGVTRTDEG